MTDSDELDELVEETKSLLDDLDAAIEEIHDDQPVASDEGSNREND